MLEISKDDGDRAAETAAADDLNASSSPQTIPPPSIDDKERTSPPASAREASTVLLRMRGLPYGANERDIEKFFENSLVAAYVCRRGGLSFFWFFGFFSVSEAEALEVRPFFWLTPSLSRLSLSLPLSRSLLSTLSGRPTGEGYAEFATPAEASRVLAEKQHGSLGNRYVELFPENGAGLEADSASAGRPLPGGLRKPVLRLRGLPFTATAEDVVDFLIGRVRRDEKEREKRGVDDDDDDEGEGEGEGAEEEGAAAPTKSSRRLRAESPSPVPPPTNPDAMPRLGPRGVVFTSSPDGRPSGEAYVEFDSARAAAAALSAKDGAALGPRFVRFFFRSF